ncbi:MAG: hypothetical protein NTW80_04520 [Deltaproteobacteria bacterium]|nr:hypothetical protein [Deltaproteobacteria bacterium]
MAQLKVGPADAVTGLEGDVGLRLPGQDGLVGRERPRPIPLESQQFRFPQAGLGGVAALGIALQVGVVESPGLRVLLAAITGLGV